MIGKTVSHYRIIEKLGEGGMGVVYKATDERLQREVAVKFLTSPEEEDTDAHDRFIQEARAAGSLNHPNIATIYEIAEEGDDEFIVMEYIAGQTLQEKIAAETGQSNFIPIKTVLNYTAQIVEGLQAAHRRQIIHRDIKSANVMVTLEDRIKLLDFGLAKKKEDNESDPAEQTLGTLAYMSPEQLSGKTVDARTDLWSVGIILYEMLTGNLPFPGDYYRAMMYSVMYEEPDEIDNDDNRIPAGLLKIVDKTLEKEPNKRYADAGELLKAINSLRSPAANVSSASTEGKKRPGGGRKEPSSVAVLPFVDLSPQKDQEYFCDGMTEELINALATVRGWRVVSRTSSFAFKGKELDVRNIGEELNVSHILEGSLRKAGNQLRISTQLIKVDDGFQIWAEKYDRELKDVFEIQENIARAIVTQLKVKLKKDTTSLVKSYTENLEAYNLYLKARFFFNRRTEKSLLKGIDFCQLAIEKDPTFTPAFSGLADGYILLSFLGAIPPADIIPKAKAAVKTALKLDANFAEAYTSLACIHAVYEWKWEKAEEEFRQALKLNSGYSTAHHWYAVNFLLPQQRFAEAMDEIRKASNLDPISPVINISVGIIYYFMGKYRNAIEQYQSVLDVDPDFGLAKLFLGRAYEQAGMYAEATTIFQNADTFADNRQEMLGELGRVYAAAGNNTEAEKALSELLAFQDKEELTVYSQYSIAAIYAVLNRKDEAFEWLEKAYSERSFRMIYLKIDPQLNNLHGDARYNALLKKLDLDGE